MDAITISRLPPYILPKPNTINTFIPRLPRPRDEYWKPIIQSTIHGVVEISTYGLVRYTETKEYLDLYLLNNSTWYAIASVESYQKQLALTKLMMYTFHRIGYKGEKPCFRDGNSLNLHIDNLFWGNKLDQFICNSKRQVTLSEISNG